MLPGDEIALRGDLRVRAVRTFHPVPSLGYIIVRRVAKLRAEFRGLPGPEIAARRRAGRAVIEHEDRLELAYATDTLVSVLDHSPELLQDARADHGVHVPRRAQDARGRARRLPHPPRRGDRARRASSQNEHIVMMHLLAALPARRGRGDPRHARAARAARADHSVRAEDGALAGLTSYTISPPTIVSTLRVSGSRSNRLASVARCPCQHGEVCELSDASEPPLQHGAPVRWSDSDPSLQRSCQTDSRGHRSRARSGMPAATIAQWHPARSRQPKRSWFTRC